MRLAIIALLIVTFSGLLYCQNTFNTTEQVYFFSNIDEAMNRARQQNKPIFIEFGADWCAPCKKMDQETFSDTRVANHLNQKYINLKVDVDQFAGMDLADKFLVKEFPTYVYLFPNGEYFARSKGYYAPDFFLKELTKNFPVKVARNTKNAKKAKR